MLHCRRKEQYQGIPTYMVRGFAFFKGRFKKTTVIKPFLIHHIPIEVIMQYFYFLIVLGVEDESFIITRAICANPSRPLRISVGQELI